MKKLLITEEILAKMEALGMTRTQLAEAMGVHQQRVTRLLNGNNNFTIKTLVRAARAVGSTLSLHLGEPALPLAANSAPPRDPSLAVKT